MKVFAAAGLKPRPLSVNSSEDETHPIYECIAALRVVLSKVEKPENWDVVQGMATHRQDYINLFIWGCS